MDARTLPTLQQLNPLNAPSPRRVKYMNSLDQIPNLSPEDREIMKKVSERYVFRANDYYLRLIDWADPKDPIKQLIIPRQEELNDWGALGATYVGILGIGLYYMAAGTLMSALSRNQIVAALLTFFVIGGLFVGGIGEFVVQGTDVGEVLGYISIWKHMEAFGKGIVDTRYLTFDLTLAVAFLFFAVRSLEARRGAQ